MTETTRIERVLEICDEWWKRSEPPPSGIGQAQATRELAKVLANTEKRLQDAEREAARARRYEEALTTTLSAIEAAFVRSGVNMTPFYMLRAVLEETT